FAPPRESSVLAAIVIVVVVGRSSASHRSAALQGQAVTEPVEQQASELHRQCGSCVAQDRQRSRREVIGKHARAGEELCEWQNLVDNTELEGVASTQGLRGEKEVTTPIGSEEVLPDEMDTVPRHGAVGEV